MNKKTLTRVLLGLTVITVIATVVAYFVIKPDRPWMAFYVACCGGVLVFNFLISLFLVNKNLKK
jgi:zinc transporter ZupT